MRAELLARLGGLIVLAGTPTWLAAQAKAEFTPFVALYVPTGHLDEETNVLQSGDKVTLKQKTSVIFGGRIGVWVTQRVGIEGSFGYSPSRAQAEYTPSGGGGTTSVDTNARVIIANARVLLGFGPTVGPTSWHVILGGGIIAHGGDAWSGTDGTTDIGGVVGLGGRFKVGSSLALRIDVEDNLYSAKFKDPSSGAETQSRFQNDLVFTGGLSIPFGK
jgi:hypothetical protein